MKVQYQFQIVFIRLSLKKPLKRETTLQLALIDDIHSNDLNNSQLPVSFQELKIKRIHKIVDLEKLTSFKFRKDQDSKVQTFGVELRLEGTDEEAELIQIKTAQLTTQFEQSKKSIFEQKYEWTVGSLEFKIYVSAKEVEVLPLNANQPALQKVSSVKSNNVSRTRRPPQLNISRKGGLVTSGVKPNKFQQPQAGKTKTEQLFKGLEKESQPKYAINTVDKKSNSLDKKPGPKYLEPQSPFSSFPENFSALFKRKHKPVEPENQHVKELIESHHPHAEGDLHAAKLSLKLKAVIMLIVIGLFFLALDTVNDRSFKKFFKGNANPNKKGHPSKKQTDKHSVKGKKTHKKPQSH